MRTPDTAKRAKSETKIVRMAASSVGWRRDPEVARKCREAMK